MRSNPSNLILPMTRLHPDKISEMVFARLLCLFVCLFWHMAKAVLYEKDLRTWSLLAHVTRGFGDLSKIGDMRGTWTSNNEECI